MKHLKPCDHAWCLDRANDEFIVATGSFGDWLISTGAVSRLRNVPAATVRFVDKASHETKHTYPGSWVLAHLGPLISIGAGRTGHVIEGL